MARMWSDTLMRWIDAEVVWDGRTFDDLRPESHRGFESIAWRTPRGSMLQDAAPGIGGYVTPADLRAATPTVETPAADHQWRRRDGTPGRVPARAPACPTSTQPVQPCACGKVIKPAQYRMGYRRCHSCRAMRRRFRERP